MLKPAAAHMQVERQQEQELPPINGNGQGKRRMIATTAHRAYGILEGLEYFGFR